MIQNSHLSIVQNREPDYRIAPGQWADLIQLITDQAEQLQQIRDLAQQYEQTPKSLQLAPEFVAYTIRKALEIDRTEDE